MSTHSVIGIGCDDHGDQIAGLLVARRVAALAPAGVGGRALAREQPARLESRHEPRDPHAGFDEALGEFHRQQAALPGALGARQHPQHVELLERETAALADGVVAPPHGVRHAQEQGDGALVSHGGKVAPLFY